MKRDESENFLELLASMLSIFAPRSLTFCLTLLEYFDELYLPSLDGVFHQLKIAVAFYYCGQDMTVAEILSPALGEVCGSTVTRYLCDCMIVYGE